MSSGSQISITFMSPGEKNDKGCGLFKEERNSTYLVKILALQNNAQFNQSQICNTETSTAITMTFYGFLNCK